jgi:hypothetical protein
MMMVRKFILLCEVIILLDKLEIAQLVKFSTFYGNQKFITVFTLVLYTSVISRSRNSLCAIESVVESLLFL